MDVIGRMVGSIATTPVTRSNREEAAELRSAFGREIDSNDNRGDRPPVQGVQGRINTENNVSEMFTYLNNGTDLYGTGAPENGLSWGSGLFEDGGTAEATAATARENIEARSESLTTEIAFDRARGYDVTDSLEAMTNLSENLSVLDANTAALAASASGGVQFHGIPEDSGTGAVSSVAASVDDSPEFAPPTALEGSVSEQIVQASAEQQENEMSIAAQIAASSKADYAASVDIMNTDNGDATERVASAGAMVQ
jgi:hypothetical protein